MDTITQDRWDALPTSYKRTNENGTRLMLKYVAGTGTCLVPVKVMDAAYFEYRSHTLETALRDLLDSGAFDLHGDETMESCGCRVCRAYKVLEA